MSGNILELRTLEFKISNLRDLEASRFLNAEQKSALRGYNNRAKQLRRKLQNVPG